MRQAAWLSGPNSSDNSTNTASPRAHTLMAFTHHQPDTPASLIITLPALSSTTPRSGVRAQPGTDSESCQTDDCPSPLKQWQNSAALTVVAHCTSLGLLQQSHGCVLQPITNRTSAPNHRQAANASPAGSTRAQCPPRLCITRDINTCVQGTPHKMGQGMRDAAPQPAPS